MENIEKEFSLEFKEVKTLKEIEEIRIKYMGKKGVVTELAKSMKEIDKEKRKEYGQKLNSIRNLINTKIDTLKEELETVELNEKLKKDTIDVTLPGNIISLGSINPLTKVINDMEELFVSMGYDVVTGPEIETDINNFEKLNLPKGHPARDMQDTFYINIERLLRTHTSPAQVRAMERSEGPLRIVCPGKTYRRDSDDATHSHQFMQMEGLVIGENISLSDLKGTLEIFAKKMFSNDTKIRFRPSYFPFTEPSLEVDISCFKCKGKGCNICKGTGWIEILGAGMVHPNVLEMSGYDSKKYTGFAFGVGAERVAMLKYGINDIRTFYTNDLRFIEQFDKLEGADNESK